MTVNISFLMYYVVATIKSCESVVATIVNLLLLQNKRHLHEDDVVPVKKILAKCGGLFAKSFPMGK
jgi:hypothetical protein